MRLSTSVKRYRPEKHSARTVPAGGREAPRAVRVVLVEKYPLFARALQAPLERARGITVVGVAKSGQDALSLLSPQRVDVLVLNGHPLGMSASELIERARAIRPAVAVLVLAGPEDGREVQQRLEGSTEGYLDKSISEEQFVLSVRTLAQGGRITLPGATSRTPEVNDVPLTPREREVLDRLLRGQSTLEMAAALAVVPKTIEFHIKNLAMKLGARSRLQIVAEAQRRGLLIRAS